MDGWSSEWIAMLVFGCPVGVGQRGERETSRNCRLDTPFGEIMKEKESKTLDCGASNLTS
jgi:hypothetical protein